MDNSKNIKLVKEDNNNKIKFIQEDGVVGSVTFDGSEFTLSHPVNGLSIIDGELQNYTVEITPESLGNDEDCGQLLCTQTIITPEEIVGDSAGSLGHADGVTLVEAQGDGTLIELVSALLIYDYEGDAYVLDSGDDSLDFLVTDMGGAGINGANSLSSIVTGVEDAMILVHSDENQPYDVATLNKALVLRNASGVYAQPVGDGATGVIRVHTTYRIHNTNLA